MDYLEYKSYDLLNDTVSLSNDAETFQMLLDTGWIDVSEKHLKEINRESQIKNLYPLSEYKKGSCKRFFLSGGCLLYFDYQTCLKISVPRTGCYFILDDGDNVPALFLEAYANKSYLKKSVIESIFNK